MLTFVVSELVNISSSCSCWFDNSFILQSGDKTVKEVQLSVREALGSKKEEQQKGFGAEITDSLDHSDDDEATFDARMRQQILRRRMDLGDAPPKPKQRNGTLISSEILIINYSHSHSTSNIQL